MSESPGWEPRVSTHRQSSDFFCLSATLVCGSRAKGCPVASTAGRERKEEQVSKLLGEPCPLGKQSAGASACFHLTNGIPVDFPSARKLRACALSHNHIAINIRALPERKAGTGPGHPPNSSFQGRPVLLPRAIFSYLC